jgi:MoxR-like ATPase
MSQEVPQSEEIVSPKRTRSKRDSIARMPVPATEGVDMLDAQGENVVRVGREIVDKHKKIPKKEGATPHPELRQTLPTDREREDVEKERQERVAVARAAIERIDIQNISNDYSVVTSGSVEDILALAKQFSVEVPDVSSVNVPDGAMDDIVAQRAHKTMLSDTLREALTPKGRAELRQRNIDKNKMYRALEKHQALETLMDAVRRTTRSLQQKNRTNGRLSIAEESKMTQAHDIIMTCELKQLQLHQECSHLDLALRQEALLQYADSIARRGFVITPSVEAQIDRITDAWKSGKWVLLTGSTGTGKTEMLINAAKETGGAVPEVLSLNEETGLAELFGITGLSDGNTEFEAGPLTRAIVGGKRIIFDEINLPSNRLLMAIKALANRKPGDTIEIPRYGVVTVRDGFSIAASMNVKSARHKDRNDLDPAMDRVFRESFNVPYLPEDELYDVLLASLIRPDGTTRALPTNATETLVNFVKVVKEIQHAFERGAMEGVDGKKNTDGTLQKSVIDTGWALDLVRAVDWQRPDAPVQIGLQLARLAARHNMPVSDRAFILNKALDFKLLNGVPQNEIAKSGVDPTKLTTARELKDRQTILLKTNEPKELTAYQTAVLDPFDKRKKVSLNDEAVDLLGGSDDVGDSENPSEGVIDIREFTAFAYDTAKAREYGFTEMRAEAHPAAQLIIDGVIRKDVSFLNSDGTLNMVEVVRQWKANCPDLANAQGETLPEKSEWYFKALFNGRITETIDSDDKSKTPTRLHTPRFGTEVSLLALDFPEFAYSDVAEKTAAISPAIKKIMKTLFNTEEVTGLSRDTINTALYADHDNRINSQKAKNIIRELAPNEDPDTLELRLMTLDEYARLASSQNYGTKSLYTYFDGYCQRNSGYRDGIIGGRTGSGGATKALAQIRDHVGIDTVVRLVLSRRETKVIPPSSSELTYDTTFTPAQEQAARREGFAKVELESHPKAQELIAAIVAKDSRFETIEQIDPTDPIMGNKSVLDPQKVKEFWATHCTTLPPIPEKSMWWFYALYNGRLDKHINSDDKNAPALPDVPDFLSTGAMFVMDYPEFDYDNQQQIDVAKNHPSMEILKTFFSTDDPTNISRDTVNTSLWEGDPDRRVQSTAAKNIVDNILGTNAHQQYELRLMHYDEYARLAQSQNYGTKNLWTHFEGYQQYDDGLRQGLISGYVGNGGAANVGSYSRDSVNVDISVRLVLARKN